MDVMPLVLPAHTFETKHNGVTRTFNLIDGGVAANNPVKKLFCFLSCVVMSYANFTIIKTLTVMTQVTKEILSKNDIFAPVDPTDYGKFIVISLGAGSAKNEGKYSAKEAQCWGVLGWLRNKGSTPLVDIFTQASGDMFDIHASVLFQALHSKEQYLRIQDDTLTGDNSSVDIPSKENLLNLVEIGEALIKKQVSRVNLETGVFEPVEGEGTNGEALIKFAKLLSEERRLRCSNVK